MIFREDFEIQVDKEGKVKQADIDKLYEKFCRHYINQIKDKLDFKSIFINILKENKENTSQLKTNPTTLSKTLNNTEEVIKKMIRFEMRMINPIDRFNKPALKKKPKISRPAQDKERTEERRKKMEVNK